MATIPGELKGHRQGILGYRLLGAIASVAFVPGLSEGWSVDRVRPVERVRPMRVVGKPRLADDVVGLVLEPVGGAPAPSWTPGSHLDVTLPSGLRRQYSLCGTDPDRLMVAVRRIGEASTEIHERVHVGDVLRTQGPRTAFPFCGERRVLLVAGGIGITPIVAMARESAARGVDWHLVYAGRSRASMPFLDEVTDLAGDRLTLLIDDERDRRPSAGELLARADDDTAVYCCGPTPLLDLVRTARGPVRAPLHYERFAPPPVTGGSQFELTLAHTGRTLQVPADRSALDVVLDTAPDTPYSCRQGFCGTCRVRVCDGAVERRGRAGGPGRPGAREMLLCTDRAEGAGLTVDL
ncbi:PDR/VanB family oxidoreductase [Dietzia natronolimnaea]|uniref:PDR/VanB family oxidoreductase n=1 Tax=Dietzia natronolimnaea TaxID=161920 RepID=UPI0015FA2B7F|nr:PDR/VanB family oxidoreductase [Dietzia natronolimnaea]MBB1038503.1 oxidoreductase [Dietzia natronolimnaea]